MARRGSHTGKCTGHLVDVRHPDGVIEQMIRRSPLTALRGRAADIAEATIVCRSE
jgi:hypothetical protein